MITNNCVGDDAAHRVDDVAGVDAALGFPSRALTNY
jgi:hypothetical protein